jgi:flagellar basal-body rod protein FlgB
VSHTISDAAITAALGRQMTRAVAKQAVAAGNLANLDTPGFRTKEIEFDDILEAELAPDALTATNARHLTAAGATAGSAVTDPIDAPVQREAEGLAARRDGNNVQLDRELLGLTRASGEFSAAQTLLAAKFRLVRYAINEGR